MNWSQYPCSRAHISKLTLASFAHRWRYKEVRKIVPIPLHRNQFTGCYRQLRKSGEVLVMLQCIHLLAIQSD